MTEIPDYVMKADYGALKIAFARAIMAERERCAKLAIGAQAEFDNDI